MTTTRKKVEIPPLMTTIFEAAKFGNVDSIGRLVASNAAINQKDQNGNTALHIAINNKRDTCVTFLVACRGDVNALDKLLCSPLHHASAEGNETLVSKVLEARADVTLKNQDGRLAIDLARINGHTGVVEMLTKAEAERGPVALFGDSTGADMRGEQLKLVDEELKRKLAEVSMFEAEVRKKEDEIRKRVGEGARMQKRDWKDDQLKGIQALQDRLKKSNKGMEDTFEIIAKKKKEIDTTRLHVAFGEREIKKLAALIESRSEKNAVQEQGE